MRHNEWGKLMAVLIPSIPPSPSLSNSRGNAQHSQSISQFVIINKLNQVKILIIVRDHSCHGPSWDKMHLRHVLIHWCLPVERGIESERMIVVLVYEGEGKKEGEGLTDV